MHVFVLLDVHRRNFGFFYFFVFWPIHIPDNLILSINHQIHNNALKRNFLDCQGIWFPCLSSNPERNSECYWKEFCYDDYNHMKDNHNHQYYNILFVFFLFVIVLVSDASYSQFMLSSLSLYFKSTRLYFLSHNVFFISVLIFL